MPCPAGVLMERLPYACAVADYRALSIYGETDGDPHQVDAFAGFAYLAQRIEDGGRRPVMVFV